MSTDSIYKFVHDGNDGTNSNCIIYSDLWNYGSRCRLVKNNENVYSVVNEIRSWGIPGLFVVDKIIDYSKDVDQQLSKIEHKTPEFINSEIMNMENVRNAIRFATYMHKEQDRKDGTPYIKHPLNVLNNVKYFKKSKRIDVLLMSAVLHDTLEDTDASYDDITYEFGFDVGNIVLELTTDEELKKLLGKEKYLEMKMERMTSYALVVKLCDRLDNVGDLLNCNNEFRLRYINETIGILDYLFNNCKFTKTHLSIIERMLYVLIRVADGEKDLLWKIQLLMEKYVEIRKLVIPEENRLKDEEILKLQKVIINRLNQ